MAQKRRRSVSVAGGSNFCEHNSPGYFVGYSDFALFFGGLFVWQLLGNNSVSAAAIELDRLIAASSQQSDRTLTIAVEETAIHENRRDSNPPQIIVPPNHRSMARYCMCASPNLFVLKRQIGVDEYFITGSNGNTSWAIRPDGPVRVSTDLSRFNHDVRDMNILCHSVTFTMVCNYCIRPMRSR